LFAWVQPDAGLQPSFVQGLPSLQFGAAPPTHAPPEHLSFVVHALPSEHDAVLFACTHPEPGLHASSVHGSPSSQLPRASPTQAPPEHVSFAVQALPSSQSLALFAFTQPDAGVHESVVHGFESSQSAAAPPTQLPPEQVSLLVHASPSEQGSELFAFTQPDPGVQPSSVHGLPSLQLTVGPPTQAPPEHLSAVVHWLPSSQSTVLFMWVQPAAAAQPSSVQGLPSSQSGAAPPTHTPPWHWSPEVQALPSLHDAAFGACTQPADTSQPSSVHGFASSHVGAGPPTHTPVLHESLVVQASPSEHDPPIGRCAQPVAGPQESSVQALPSSQFAGPPGRQLPWTQASPAVHALPSVHGSLFSTLWQPASGSQKSSVQGFPSPQFGAPEPTHAPPAHWSPSVHTFPSLHGFVFGNPWHPADGLQKSSVHGLPSSQLSGAPETQTPPWQVSLKVQALPSEHGPSLFWCTQPRSGLHPSVVHGLPSSQSSATPETHSPFRQPSPKVQALPSSQGPGCLVCTQPCPALQVSAVQSLPSSHPAGCPPTQAPPLHTSPSVHTSPSLHGAMFGV
jgi:hypothetical protein